MTSGSSLTRSGSSATAAPRGGRARTPSRASTSPKASAWTPSSSTCGRRATARPCSSTTRTSCSGPAHPGAELHVAGVEKLSIRRSPASTASRGSSRCSIGMAAGFATSSRSRPATASSTARWPAASRSSRTPSVWPTAVSWRPSTPNCIKAHARNGSGHRDELSLRPPRGASRLRRSRRRGSRRRMRSEPKHDLVSPALLAQAAAAGLTVHPWTVDEAAEIRSLLASGISLDHDERAGRRPGDPRGKLNAPRPGSRFPRKVREPHAGPRIAVDRGPRGSLRRHVRDRRRTHHRARARLVPADPARRGRHVARRDPPARRHALRRGCTGRTATSMSPIRCSSLRVSWWVLTSARSSSSRCRT